MHALARFASAGGVNDIDRTIKNPCPGISIFWQTRPANGPQIQSAITSQVGTVRATLTVNFTIPGWNSSSRLPQFPPADFGDAIGEHEWNTGAGLEAWAFEFRRLLVTILSARGD